MADNFDKIEAANPWNHCSIEGDCYAADEIISTCGGVGAVVCVDEEQDEEGEGRSDAIDELFQQTPILKPFASHNNSEQT
jgi:hypothetical protein